MEREKLVKYIEMGYSTRKIAAAEETSQINVRYWLKKFDLKTNPARKPRRKCLICGNEVDKKYTRYCRECISNGLAFHKGHKAILMPFNELQTDKSRKKWLLQNREHRCESCGLTEWQGHPITLELHHVDGDADNNVLENLQLLCPNCHSLTPTFRSKNRGSITRRKLYRKNYYNS